MPRGLFTQSVVLLLERPPSLPALLDTLEAFDVLSHRPQRAPATWLGGFPEVVVGYRPDRNGLATVEIVDRPWPDPMGDPKSDPELFGAWSLGAFGPATFPGNLTRAGQQSPVWRSEAQRVVDSHRAMLRLRTSWLLGAAEDPDEETPARPPDESAVDELVFLTRLARAACAVEGTLAFFNPGGEVLLAPPRLGARLDRAAAEGRPPIDTFANVRMATFAEAPQWALMDTIGMDQVDLPDHEAVFEPERHDPNVVAGWLMELALYTLQAGDVLAPTHTVDGPGGVWRCHEATDEPWMLAPRRTLRWTPDGASLPPALRGAAQP